jgi:NAD-specific glutamate dehydrogenase
VRGRFGRWALVVGALAAIIAWLVRRREVPDPIRESYETTRERIREARERLSGWVQETRQDTVEETARGTEEGGRSPREEMRSIIRESIRRSRGEA